MFQVGSYVCSYGKIRRIKNLPRQKTPSTFHIVQALDVRKDVKRSVAIRLASSLDKGQITKASCVRKTVIYLIREPLRSINLYLLQQLQIALQLFDLFLQLLVLEFKLQCFVLSRLLFLLLRFFVSVQHIGSVLATQRHEGVGQLLFETPPDDGHFFLVHRF